MRETGSPPSGAAPLETLIEAADRGDAAANRVLFERLYAELHRLAESQLRRMTNPNLTLGATTVLHEFYLAMSGRESTSFPDRSRFMAYAARAMRGLIINYVRDRAPRSAAACIT
jgi:DNA-directed RNA polymerase specialized sigma24 family protein